MREVGVTEVPKDAQLIDVREPEEFSEAHAQGAVNVPLSQLPERVHEIDPERDIYIICHSGGRSAQAVEYVCLLYTSPSPRDAHESRMPSSA